MGYLGATLIQVFTRARVEWTCHSEMLQWLIWETGLASANNVTHRKRAEDFGILKKSVSGIETCLGRRRLAFACSRRPWAGVAWDRCRWKSQNGKNVNLSPYVEEPLNSKLIKCFVPELSSLTCFSCFEIPVFYVIYIYEHYMSISHIHIGLWYTYRLHIQT